MAELCELKVDLIASSSFHAPEDVEWIPDGGVSDAEALVEFAGRACYETFDKPNPRTAANNAYLHHVMEVGHHALLEHATATMYVRGLSMGAVVQLLRHRHFSFSQLSQRYVHPDEATAVLPLEIAQDEELARLMERAVDDSRFVYNELLDALEEKLAGEPNTLIRKKQARQAARAILPAATETRIVVTGNFRTWRHFIAVRASEQADREIRTLAVTVLELLKKESPALFSDFRISTLADGSKMASSPLVSEH